MVSENQNEGSAPEEGGKAESKNYEHLINRLKKEREALQELVDRDYREARRYVRSHPEEGVSLAFIGGLALGYILGKLGK